MLARLFINEAGYQLARLQADDWVELASLPGGPLALLPGPRPVDQGALEAAIEHAEDWLMPYAVALNGADLEVVDSTGQLAAGLREIVAADTDEWDVEQLEALFLEVDFMTARPHIAVRLEALRETVAAIVLLRELAHHAKLRRVSLRGEVL